MILAFFFFSHTNPSVNYVVWFPSYFWFVQIFTWILLYHSTFIASTFIYYSTCDHNNNDNNNNNHNNNNNNNNNNNIVILYIDGPVFTEGSGVVSKTVMVAYLSPQSPPIV